MHEADLCCVSCFKIMCYRGVLPWLALNYTFDNYWAVWHSAVDRKKKTAVCVSVTICFFFPGRKLLKPWLTGNSAWIKISGGCENAAVMVCWVLVGFPSVLLWGVFGEIYPVGARTRRCLVCMLTPTLWLDRSCCTRQTGNRVSVASMFSDSLFALSLADQSNLTSSKPSFIICSRSPSMAGWQTFVCFIYLGGEYILLLFA